MTGCNTIFKDLSPPDYLPIAGSGIVGFIAFDNGINSAGNANNLHYDLNSVRCIHLQQR